MIQIYSATQIAKETGLTRDYIHKLFKKGVIPSPAYVMNGMYGWTREQMECIKENLSK
jgi:predicted DNA-binding transcriptional regulator AlpA